MGSMNPFGLHSQRHPSPAMNWFLVAARKDVSNAVNAKKPHSSVQLSVGVKGNVQGTEHSNKQLIN